MYVHIQNRKKIPGFIYRILRYMEDNLKQIT